MYPLACSEDTIVVAQQLVKPTRNTSTRRSEVWEMRERLCSLCNAHEGTKAYKRGRAKITYKCDVILDIHSESDSESLSGLDSVLPSSWIN